MGTPLSGYVTAKSDLTSSSTGDRATCPTVGYPAVGYWGWREDVEYSFATPCGSMVFQNKPFLKSAVT